MPRRKLELSHIKIKSFVTALSAPHQFGFKGGNETLEVESCVVGATNEQTCICGSRGCNPPPESRTCPA